MTPPMLMEILFERGLAMGPVKLHVLDQTHLLFRNPRRPRNGPNLSYHPPVHRFSIMIIFVSNLFVRSGRSLLAIT